METYRCRNIQTAANHLYISHQGLSRVIRSLEEELGATLFTRSNRGLEPTDYATALLPHVQTLLDTYSRIDGLYMQERRQKTHVTVYSLDHLMNWLSSCLAFMKPGRMLRSALWTQRMTALWMSFTAGGLILPLSTGLSTAHSFHPRLSSFHVTVFVFIGITPSPKSPG